MAPKKSTFILIVVLASLLSASFADGHRKLINNSAVQVGEAKKDQFSRKLFHYEGALTVHPRILVVKTNDYGGYDPAPSFSKPIFKPIPN